MKYIPLTVNNKMAFDAFDLLEAVNPLDRVRQSAATACAVYETDSRIFIASTPPSGIFYKKLMDSIEYAFGIPVSPFVIYGFPVRITQGQKPPLTATAQKVEYRFENTDGVVLPSAFHQRWERIDQNRPLPTVNLGNVNERIIIVLFQKAV